MFPLRCSNLLCVQLRTFSKTIPRLDRFSRDSLRNRIYKQNIKDLAKQNIQGPGPSTLPYAGDVVALRPSRDLWKALGFTAFVGVTSFTLAVVSDLERTRKLPKTLQQAATNFFNETFRGVPDNENNLTWKQLSAGEKNCFYLVGANLLVFVLWRVKALQPFMWRYFTNSFASRSLCLPMLLSAFSHSNLLHFGLNMYVVYSFASLAADKFLGVDQFWGFYCVAAVVSSLASLLHKSAVRSSVRALGASGAILALLTYTCMKMPDARLKIVFVPFFDFSAQAAVFGILLFDLCGLVFKFRLFDHAAHLGGALFGVFYALLGEHFIWQHYGNLVEEYYRKIRKE